MALQVQAHGEILGDGFARVASVVVRGSVSERDVRHVGGSKDRR